LGSTKEVEHAAIGFLEKSQTIKEALKSGDVRKWEIDMQE
jgi:hypothetical protein